MTDIDGMVYQKYPDCCFRDSDNCDLTVMEPKFRIRHNGYTEVAYVSKDRLDFTVIIEKK